MLCTVRKRDHADADGRILRDGRDHRAVCMAEGSNDRDPPNVPEFNKSKRREAVRIQQQKMIQSVVRPPCADSLKATQ